MKILLYNINFSNRFSTYDELRASYVESSAVFTRDKSLFNEVDAIVFNLPHLPASKLKDHIKRKGQVWVGWNLECEKNYTSLLSDELKSLIDVWMTYHPNSDVPIPYLNADFPERTKAAVPLPGLKDICMFVSSPVNDSRRIEYLRELMRYIRIDSYGKLFHNVDLPNDRGYKSKLEVISKYKFTIAFENAIYQDYVTEKFYEPLLAGSIPVYLGAPNIGEFSPRKNAFLNVSEFPDPKDLAAELKRLCTDEQSLKEFYRWKKEPLNDRFLEIANNQRVNPFERLINVVNSKHGLYLF